jgi:hypothetical protein
VLQKALNPVSGEPVTVHVPAHGCKQSQDSGPLPQPFGTHSVGWTAPPACCSQICPAGQVTLPPIAGHVTVAQGPRLTTQTLFVQ